MLLCVPGQRRGDSYSQCGGFGPLSRALQQGRQAEKDVHLYRILFQREAVGFFRFGGLGRRFERLGVGLGAVPEDDPLWSISGGILRAGLANKANAIHTTKDYDGDVAVRMEARIAKKRKRIARPLACGFAVSKPSRASSDSSE